jgi:hypothetical protein
VIQILDFIFKNNKKIIASFITKQGKLDTVTKYPDSSTFEYNKGSYTINKECKLNKSGSPAFVYIEGIPDPLNFTNIKKPIDLKIDSEGLRAVLKANLFYDLFNDDKEQIKEIVVYICLGIIIIGIGYLAFALDKQNKSILEVKSMLNTLDLARQLIASKV